MPRNKNLLERGGLTVMLRAEIEMAKPVIESLGWVLPPKKAVQWRESRFCFEALCCAAAISEEKSPPILPECFKEFRPAFYALTFFLRLKLKEKTLRDAAASTGSLDRFYPQSKNHKLEIDRRREKYRKLSQNEGDAFIPKLRKSKIKQSKADEHLMAKTRKLAQMEKMSLE
jgi:hypothetical protein